MDLPPAVSTRALTKRYGPILALDGLDLDVPAGSVSGLLGPSGSGKSTTLRLLAGLARASGGTAIVAGIKLGDRHGVELRRKLGILPPADAVYEWMSGREQLSLAAELAGLSRTDIPARVTAMLERVGLTALGDARTALYDFAERRRLGFGQALIGDPEVVLLDEPLAGLDPACRDDVLAILGGLRDRATVVLSSADPADVEAACDRVAVLERGRLVLAARVDALLGGVRGTSYTIELDGRPGLGLAGLVARLEREPWVESVEGSGQLVRVTVRDRPRAARELLPAVVATGLPVASFRRARPTLSAAISEAAARASAGARAANREAAGESPTPGDAS